MIRITILYNRYSPTDVLTKITTLSKHHAQKNNTATPSPIAPTQVGKTRNRRKRKPRKTHTATKKSLHHLCY